MTPHINATKDQIAPIVLMPGDPLRAKWIATNFLEDVELVNSVRNMLMYTGTYKNKRVTIAGSGMGCASIGIYSYELYKYYDVEAIIRIGSAGAYTEDLKIYDVLNVISTYGENNYAKIVADIDDNMLNSSEELYKIINYSANELNLDIIPSIVHTSDVFYRKNKNDYQNIFKKWNAVAVEMEAFALFTNAKALNKQAGCILTISDSLVTEQATSSEEREKSFVNMVNVSLQTVLNFYNKNSIKLENTGCN